MRNLCLLAILAIGLSSCVPGKQFQEMELKAEDLQKENDRLKKINAEQETEMFEMLGAIEDMNKRMYALEDDTTLYGNSIRKLRVQYDKINELNEQMMDKQATLMSSNAKEKEGLLTELNATEQALRQQEAELEQLAKVLNEKSAMLNDREARVNELEQMIAANEDSARELKNKVADALLAFKDKGLSVEQRNGRVYVNLEAKLLFDSGSDKVEAEGKKALMQLADAIESQEDLSILVEGHTDKDKVGSGMPYKDNWDLSVMRATSVVRILTDNSDISPEILTAAGRGEFIPVDVDDKAKNRRIEIILTPKLDELYSIIGNAN
ncbi:MAG: OmpA family protein [Flavobacteriales bacterium]|nr:OmpA family protein [Flavobacteriales bacterium]